jgi:NAD(P)-dependent dehydrogenase (short-subunit alcohol dehydrogenase family)
MSRYLLRLTPPKKGRPEAALPLPGTTKTGRTPLGVTAAFVATTARRSSRAEGPRISCPAAYHAPVESTMTFCINDVNSAATFELMKRGGRSRPPGCSIASRSRHQQRLRQHREPRPDFVRRYSAVGDMLDAGDRRSLVSGLVVRREWNAGIQGAVGPFLTYDDDELWRIMQVNYFSCWLTMKYAIPHMVRGAAERS